ncbi:RNA binding protein, heterogenous nuclear RNP-K like protein [Coniosporium tulheliwenetii]|uniref:RNA binding protein, heterogenous nuclear RNP-K like protein n=1 Tax=Coniosporium tulheliwenetii TaxID=3383036 RepID=A0ACC2YQ68_9PEZI|nr:RNA binding protein, heterogenous nuclear RNP-K like protein [Cladosporium sp. JES 115]
MSAEDNTQSSGQDVTGEVTQTFDRLTMNDRPEAGVIIGKGGQNVADLRDKTGVKAGVSKVVPGVHDRVLTVTGPLNAISRAYKIVASALLEGAPQMGMGGVINANGTHHPGCVRSPHGCPKEMLPQSTERIVEVQGTPDGIEKAVWEIGKCLIDDAERGYGTVLYNPTIKASGSVPLNNGPAATPTTNEDGEELQTQNISIPSDMVGCIIGRGGSKISEIRKSSGARISIAKAPHDESGERMFTITGSASSNEKALYLLYENLEAEKMRRSQGAQE